MNKNTPRYQALFTVAIDGIIVINNRGIIQEVNKSALDLFQYKEKELIGKNINILMPSPHKEAHDGYINTYKTTRKKKIIGIGRNVDGLKKDGTQFPFRLAISEILEGEEQLFAGVIHDLSKEKKAEERLTKHTEELEIKVQERTKELENSQRMYMAMAKNFPNGTVSILDKDLKIIFTEGNQWKNRAISPKDLTGKSYISSLGIEKVYNDKLRETFENKPVSFNYVYNDNHFEIVAVPLIQEDSITSQILVVENNVTEQTQARIEITNALEKEKKVHEMKTRFVSMASHEFRTPLSTILSSATLLGKYPSTVPEKTEKHIQRIKSNIQNLSQILDDFLSIDRINTGQLKAQLSSFNLLELITEIEEELKPMCKQKQTIKNSFPSINLNVFLDKQLLRNILINILSNAIKYSEKEIKVTVTTGKKLEIIIKDSGIGIPKEEQRQLFQRFFRAENALNIQGTGLGLHIVKRYLDLLKGEIQLESLINEGTSVHITFNNF